MYGGFFPSLVHSSLFSAVFFGTFAFFWEVNNRDYARSRGLRNNLPHQRDVHYDDVQPVHYELLGKSILVITCGYTVAQILCYPLGVYRNMKWGKSEVLTIRMIQSMGAHSPSPLFEEASSLRRFFCAKNRPVLYAGMWTRVFWSVMSCSMGIVFGSAMLTKSYREKQK